MGGTGKVPTGKINYMWISTFSKHIGLLEYPNMTFLIWNFISSLGSSLEMRKYILPSNIFNLGSYLQTFTNKQESKLKKEASECWPRWRCRQKHLIPCTTKRRIKNNLKTINNQKCQRIKLYGTPTTKELKKHSSRPVGGADTGHGQPRGEDTQQGGRLLRQSGAGWMGN